MKWIVTISALPDRSEAITVEAARSIDALRDVMGREMLVEALARRPEAALCISVMKPAKKDDNGAQRSERPTTTGGLRLR